MFIRTLQAQRGIAALAVVFHHAAMGTSSFSGEIPASIESVFHYGYLGVDFFFVLSGFIIYYAYFQTKPTVRHFVIARARRIYTPYLPIGIAIAIAYVFLPSLSGSAREWAWLPTLTLLPSFDPPALSVAWTLQHELVFYGVFCLFAAMNQIKVGMALWSGSIFIFLLAGLSFEGPEKLLLAPINLEFSMGMCIAIYYLSGRAVAWIPTCVLGMLFIGLFFLLGADRDLSPLFGLGVSFFILLFVDLERNEKISPGKLSVFIGSASYLIYLLHNPAISITSRLADGWVSGLFFGVVAGTATGCLYYLLIEKPSLSMFRKKIK